MLDVGKSNVKLVLVDAATLAETRVLGMPNRVRPGPPYPHYDIEGIWEFVLEGLRELRPDAIAVAAHGAAAALLAADRTLAAPVLDYEHDGPDGMAAAYDALRPPFAETGSPRLPRGLNLGAQLHWQLARDPSLDAALAAVVTYPQYWAGRLTGVWRTEVTSLGAHTDLWTPGAGTFSALVRRLGLAGRMAPLTRADACLGPVLPAIAAAAGLAPGTPVFAGLHDSNASLYPHLLARPAPFTVVSTGTWVIAMAVGGSAALDPARDTLVNVDALGGPVPSARFMGGREFGLIAGPEPARVTDAATAAVLDGPVMLWPSFEPTSGPFPGRAPGWSHDAARLAPAEIAAAASLYLALMTATCLALVGAAGPVIVEGPLAANGLYLDMLEVASGLATGAARGTTGTAVGAALLTGIAAPEPEPPEPRSVARREALRVYAERWRAVVG